MNAPGAAVRISVGPDGSPWVVNASGEIYRWAGAAFERMPGLAKDIGVGADGSVWVIGSDDGVFKWNGQGWDRVPGAGAAISVSRTGAPWLVNASGEVYRWTGDRFQLQPGRGLDIAAESGTWLIGADQGIYRFVRGNWVQQPGQAVRISLAPDGSPWVVNPAGEIFRWNGSAFDPVPGRGSDIGVGADGTVWKIGIAEQPRAAPSPTDPGPVTGDPPFGRRVDPAAPGPLRDPRITPTVDAATDWRCNRYARVSLEQQQTNIDMKCNFSGPAWQANRDNHYWWCVGVPERQSLDAMASRRKDLERCHASKGNPIDPGTALNPARKE